jgi:hypothetical protein
VLLCFKAQGGWRKIMWAELRQGSAQQRRDILILYPRLKPYGKNTGD